MSLNSSQFFILISLLKKEYIVFNEIQEKFKEITKRTIYNYINQLKSQNLIEIIETKLKYNIKHISITPQGKNFIIQYVKRIQNNYPGLLISNLIKKIEGDNQIIKDKYDLQDDIFKIIFSELFDFENTSGKEIEKVRKISKRITKKIKSYTRNV